MNETLLPSLFAFFFCFLEPLDERLDVMQEDTPALGLTGTLLVPKDNGILSDNVSIIQDAQYAAEELQQLTVFIAVNLWEQMLSGKLPHNDASLENQLTLHRKTLLCGDQFMCSCINRLNNAHTASHLPSFTFIKQRQQKQSKSPAWGAASDQICVEAATVPECG